MDGGEGGNEWVSFRRIRQGMSQLRIENLTRDDATGNQVRAEGAHSLRFARVPTTQRTTAIPAPQLPFPTLHTLEPLNPTFPLSLSPSASTIRQTLRPLPSLPTKLHIPDDAPLPPMSRVHEWCPVEPLTGRAMTESRECKVGTVSEVYLEGRELAETGSF